MTFGTKINRSPSSRLALTAYTGTSLVPRLSPRTKNQKERGEPGKIYHVRNVIGRENLITCGRTNESVAHALLTEYTRSVAKALWPLLGSTASYGERT